MEPLFENKFISTKEDLKEFSSDAFKDTNYVPLNILLIVILILAAITLTENFMKGAMCGAIFMVVVVLIKAISNTSKTAELLYNRGLEQNHGNPMTSILTFTGEKVIADNSINTHVEFPYNYIKKVKTTKNLIVVLTNANVAYILRKDSFTKGTPDEFLEFINSKINSNR